MLKRPQMLVLLVISYSIFILFIHIPTIIEANSLANTNLASMYNILEFYSAYLKYMHGIVYLVFMLSLLYGILSLESWGFILQILFSIISLLAVTFRLIGVENILTQFLISDLEVIPSFLWGVFNAYIVMYFLKPEIYKLFLYPTMKRQIYDSDLVSILNLPHKLSQYADKAIDKIYSDDWYSENIEYFNDTKILIAKSDTLAQQATLDELSMQINSNAKKIKLILVESLPKFRDAHIINEATYKKYETFYWTTEQIIETFKMSAINLCVDKSDFTDKLLKFSKKIDELELLTKTNEQMQKWISNTGVELGRLLKENVE